MSTDLDRLLHDASPDPSGAPDPDALWAAGRRRRRLRAAAAVTSGAAAVAVVAALSVVLVTPAGPPLIEPVGEPDEPTGAAEEPAPADVEEPVGDAAPDGDTTVDRDAGEAEAAPDEEPAPQPDPAALDDPCAEHEGREGDAFVDVVAPVPGQELTGTFELVGCSNVPEATVRYRIVDAGGATLVDDFTTATCGTGCVGEFHEAVELPASGDLTVEVFWEDLADGSERDLVTVPVTAR